jgi:fructokinase
MKMNEPIRIGVDLGGTKIEGLALERDGSELARQRIATPRFDYNGTVAAVAGLVARIEAQTTRRGSVGVAIPGTISFKTGHVKNANSTWLNGKPFDQDLGKALGREVRMANDANCLAVSEASDGAGAGKHLVFAAILGTGCGAGISIDGSVHPGINGVAGEWGHNSLPWPRADEFPGPACYCGRKGCIETWISGTGLEADYQRASGIELKGAEIVAKCAAGDPAAIATMERYEDRMARALAHVVNLLDPDVIVLGGGLSGIARLYENVPPKLREYVFGTEADTPIVAAKHGDSSGVRGAAWLWPLSGNEPKDC